MGNRIIPPNLLPISTKDIVGVTDGSNAATGRLGWYSEVLTNTAHGFAATGDFRDMDTVAGSGAISLGPGDYEIGMTVTASLAGATMSNWFFGIGTVTGDSATGMTFNDGTLWTGPAPTAAYDVTGSLLVRKSIDIRTTFYAKVSANFSAGLPTYAGIMWVRRRR